MSRSTLLACLAAAIVWAAPVRDASACGGCFHPKPTSIQQSEATQVTGHRMVLSLSLEHTTLYDQIEYVGEPSSFAWVLPIKGTVTVGLSSDLVFEALDDVTHVKILSPTITCPPPKQCGPAKNLSSSFVGVTTGTGTGPSTGNGGGVTILAQETVGPYETVQLSATDPNALTDWLTSHGYEIPADIKPVIAAFVAEKSNFLALKLVPGAGVSAMRPVRVTTAGAGLSLPMRMVAAGTGATTTVTLWIVSEGRYQPQNAPWFEIHASDLTWNWDSQSSDYSTLLDAHYAASGGTAWQVEFASTLYTSNISTPIFDAAKFAPSSSGYDPSMALSQASEDMGVLYGDFAAVPWVTRLRAELSRKALDEDLVIEAAALQTVQGNNLARRKDQGDAALVS